MYDAMLKTNDRVQIYFIFTHVIESGLLGHKTGEFFSKIAERIQIITASPIDTAFRLSQIPVGQFGTAWDSGTSAFWLQTVE